MAVFSNDPRAQQLWNRSQMLNLITSRPCPATREKVTDLCNNDPDKLRRLGYAGCRKVETVKNDCQDYNSNVKEKSRVSAELEKYLKDTANEKARKDKQAAEFAAEQAILARRRATNASLEGATRSACVSVMNVQEPKRTAILEACNKARVNQANNKFNVEGTRVTFDEVARELGTSKASGKKPAKLKAKAKAKAKAAAKLKKKNR